MATPEQIPTPYAYDPAPPSHSRYRNRLWLALVVALAFLFIGLVVWNKYTAPNVMPAPVEQGEYAKPTTRTN